MATFETLVELLRHAEGSTGEECFTSKVYRRVRALADVFVNNRATLTGQRAADGGWHGWRLYWLQKALELARVTQVLPEDRSYQGVADSAVRESQSSTKMGRVECYACGGFGHIKSTLTFINLRGNTNVHRHH